MDSLHPGEPGSKYLYSNKGCRCQECMVAKSIYMREWRKKVKAGDLMPRTEPQHGERRKYLAGCRCPECGEANRLYKYFFLDGTPRPGKKDPKHEEGYRPQGGRLAVPKVRRGYQAPAQKEKIGRAPELKVTASRIVQNPKTYVELSANACSEPLPGGGFCPWSVPCRRHPVDIEGDA